jgi:hypothetical protein
MLGEAYPWCKTHSGGDGVPCLPRRNAHKDGVDWFKKIHPLVIEDCCQLVKANSIKGNKQDNVSVVFTPASNLKKTQGMETGQVRRPNPPRLCVILSRDAARVKRVGLLIISRCCSSSSRRFWAFAQLDEDDSIRSPGSSPATLNSPWQVGYHNQNLVFKAKIPTRRNEIVNRLDKTKKWEETDLMAELIQRNKEERVVAAKEAEVNRIAREKQEAEVRETSLC